MKVPMNSLTRSVVLAVLLSSTGCRAEMSDARRDHVLAGNHGWIDLTLTAPPRAVEFDASKRCLVSFSANGERQLMENVHLAGAPGQAPFGYRFVVPSGKLKTELSIDGCVPLPVVVTLPLDMPKDHLARLAFDGSSLVLQGATPFEPTSLEWVRGEMLKLHASGGATDVAVAKLTSIAMLSLALNVLALIVFFVARRKR